MKWLTELGIAILVFVLLMILGAAVGAGMKSVLAAPILQDPALTPGAVTQEPLRELCKTGTDDERKPLSAHLKAQIFTRYGITRMSSDECGYQIDHLIPNGIGGTSDIDNLWPQTLCGDWNAYDKDRLDRWARKEVCEGRMNLEDARNLFTTDWTQSYLKVFGHKAGE